MTTFSQLVDSIVEDTRRPDLRTTIAGYVNQTIRELHIGPNGAVQRYQDNLVEIELDADEETGFQYELPNPARFQQVEAVYYTNLGVYADLRNPGSAFAFQERPFGKCYWYRSGNYLIFNEYGGLDAEIKLAYFQYPSRLKYYAATGDVRPATWDDEAGWTYHADYDVNATTRAEARALVSTWLTERWEDLVSQTARAKVWARLNDEGRSKVAYSNAESFKAGMIAAETYISGTRYRS